MEQKLSNEERATIFALYIGCPVRFRKNQAMVQFTADSFQIGLIENGFDPQGAQLLLTPISEISDEHLLQLAKIWQPDYDWKVVREERASPCIYADCKDYRLWILFEKGEFISFEEKDYEKQSEVVDAGADIIYMIDQLRQWGYALPYKNIDLFEAGIAIKKETK